MRQGHLNRVWTQPMLKHGTVFGLPKLQAALWLFPSPGPGARLHMNTVESRQIWSWESTELRRAELQRSRPKWERQLLFMALGHCLTSARRWSSRRHLQWVWWLLLGSKCAHATTGRWRGASMALVPHSCTGLKSLFCFITLRFF